MSSTAKVKTVTRWRVFADLMLGDLVFTGLIYVRIDACFYVDDYLIASRYYLSKV